jgi:hypothetical protein
MERFHYLGDGDIVGETLRYVAENATGWLALVGWGAAALKSRFREAYIGWDEKTKYRRLHLVANNVRFLILPRVPHLASSVLGANIRRLSRDWQQRYGHPILLAETFVDLNRFAGTCYRAANWTYLGQTRGVGRRGAGFQSHGEPKGLFVYPLHRRAREILASPFPSPEIGGGHSMADLSIDVNRLPLEGEGGLIDVLRQISDPRQSRGLRHPLESILAMAVLAVLCGARSYEAIAEWSGELPRDVRRRLGSRRYKAPSETTFRRVLQLVNAAEIDEKIGEWLVAQKVLKSCAIAIDGKTLRGSRDGEVGPSHLLSAVTHDSCVVVAQEQVEQKTNEIKHTRPLLEGLDLEGTVVTADAMHTQKEFARYLVEEKKADYVFLAKDNQSTLREDIELLDWQSFPPSGENAQQGARPDRDAHDLGT